MDAGWFVVVICCCIQYIYGYDTAVPACDSNIYCAGPLLHAVQTSGLFKDSKTFVDMSLKASQDKILSEFSKLQQQYTDVIPKDTLAEFVNTYFSGPGDEFLPWTPSDLPRIPSFLEGVKDPRLYDFGWDLCNIWKDLGRKIKSDLLNQTDRYSLLYLPNPFIVPGGRFRETYYWDTYWVIKGLLLCQMNQTARGMLENFSYMIETVGHIPNGGRVYYLRRSQPPLFIPMAFEYYNRTGDKDFVKNNLASMEKEYRFWVENRSVSIRKGNTTRILSRYAVDMAAPRPEAYREDTSTADGLSLEDRLELYSNLVSACESGWDFSSRWYSDPSGTSDTCRTDHGLKRTKTKDVIPVDLNSILCWNERILADFFALNGDTPKADFYTEQFRRRRSAINDVLWDEDAGIWFDFSISQNKSRQNFYASNMFPLFTGCGHEDAAVYKRQLASVYSYIKNNNIELSGGLPTSLYPTGQQWDLPNVWPPLQHAWIVGLTNTDHPSLRDIALTSVQTWVHSVYSGWNRTRVIFEKYSATDPGSRGAGGEYDVQEGFGWTNGAILDLLSMYGDRLSVPGPQGVAPTSYPRGVSAAMSHCAEWMAFWMMFCAVLFIMM